MWRRAFVQLMLAVFTRPAGFLSSYAAYVLREFRTVCGVAEVFERMLRDELRATPILAPADHVKAAQDGETLVIAAQLYRAEAYAAAYSRLLDVYEHRWQRIVLMLECFLIEMRRQNDAAQAAVRDAFRTACENDALFVALSDHIIDASLEFSVRADILASAASASRAQTELMIDELDRALHEIIRLHTSRKWKLAYREAAALMDYVSVHL